MNERVTRFNHVAGNAPLGYWEEDKEKVWQQIINQAERVYEEAKELLNAAKAHDGVEVLDGHLDVWYTNSYMCDLLKALRVDVAGAKYAVVENNDSKMTTSANLAAASSLEYNSAGIGTYVDQTIYENTLYYSVKRKEDNKIMKLKNHVKPDLTEFVPDGWRE